MAKRLRFQVADVHTPLLSVTKLADAGFDCVLGRSGGNLIDTVTVEKIPVRRKGSLYVMKLWLKQDDTGGMETTFQRQGRQRRGSMRQVL